jgi:hypothetical protein
MAVYHRTQRLQIYGEKPEVTQLFGGRYRMVVRCKAARDTEAWYNDNKDQIFASFGTLYSAQMSVDGIDPRWVKLTQTCAWLAIVLLIRRLVSMLLALSMRL